MAIQASIELANGTTATFHVVDRITVNPTVGTALAHYSSWLDKAHFDDGSIAMSGADADVSPVLAVPPSANLSTVGAQSIDAVEKFMLTLPAFTGGSQV